jgi:hypothetical protein
MRIEITVETRCVETGNERNYVYAFESSDRTKLEDIEAHVSNVVRTLDRQANETLDDEDAEDEEGWTKATG